MNSKYYLLLFVLVLGLSCAGPERTSIDYEIALSKSNVLQVNIKNEALLKPVARFGVYGEKIKKEVRPVLLDGKHVFRFTPLLSSTKYEFEIEYQNNLGSKELSKKYGFESPALGSSVPSFDLVYRNEDFHFDGYIQLRNVSKPGGQLLINDDAQVVWYNYVNRGLDRSFSQLDSTYVGLASSNEIVEINYYGDTINYVVLPPNIELHHEIGEDKLGNYIALTKEYLPVDLSLVGGMKEDTVITDGIMIMNEDGDVLWNWNLSDVIDPMTEKDMHLHRKDWGHANSVFVDNDGDLLISWRDFNEVWKVSRQNGNIIWKLDRGSLDSDENYYYAQHAFHRNGQGQLVMFDNGSRKTRSTSRGLIFSYDGKKFEEIHSIVLPDSLFSFKQGSAYVMNDDKVLFCSSMTNSIAILNVDSEVLWLAKSNTSFYRAEYMDMFP